MGSGLRTWEKRVLRISSMVPAVDLSVAMSWRQAPGRPCPALSTHRRSGGRLVHGLILWNS